jgi:hypothetical protein
MNVYCQEHDSLPMHEDIFSLIKHDVKGQGNVDIYQKPGIHLLIDTHVRLNEKNGIDGYRIQIYSGSGRDAREKAYSLQQQFLEKFPEFDPDLTYIIYDVPNFKLRLGDFRNKNEAFEFYHLVRRYFPNSYMVKSKINFPKLEQTNELSVEQ